MKYLEIIFEVTPNNEATNDTLAALLGEIGFDSFAEYERGTLAYIQSDLFDKEKLEALITNFPIEIQITYSVKELEDKDWNEEWEKNYFSPIILDGKCVVKSSFHKNVPDQEYTIIINPKMAFGTGHHQTTILMMEEILKKDFSGESVLDMGCGTAILAILASMRKAKDVLAIDIDQWAYDNAIENLELNNINNVSIQIGDAELLNDNKFDTIIANINRNVLLEDMHIYSSVLNENGVLLMSGFFVDDIPAIKQEANTNNLIFEYYTEKDNWAGVKFIKM